MINKNYFIFSFKVHETIVCIIRILDNMKIKDEKFSSYLLMLWNFYFLSEEMIHSERIKDKERTIYIDSLQMSALDFDLTNEDKQRLIKSGQEAVEFFLQLNRNKNGN